MHCPRVCKRLVNKIRCQIAPLQFPCFILPNIPRICHYIPFTHQSKTCCVNHDCDPFIFGIPNLGPKVSRPISTIWRLQKFCLGTLACAIINATLKVFKSSGRGVRNIDQLVVYLNNGNVCLYLYKTTYHVSIIYIYIYLHIYTYCMSIRIIHSPSKLIMKHFKPCWVKPCCCPLCLQHDNSKELRKLQALRFTLAAVIRSSSRLH